MGLPFVKQYREERELTILLAIDISESGVLVQVNDLKENGWQNSVPFLLSAVRHGDKVGLLLFAEEVEQFLPPAKGQKHVLRILREILFFKNKTKRTNLNEGLRFINQVMRRKAVVFFLSDFIIPSDESTMEENPEDLFYKELSSTRRRHDLICAQVHDPHEIKLPWIGLTTFEDAETGETITMDLSDRKFHEDFADKSNNQLLDFSKKLKKRGIDFLGFLQMKILTKP